MKFIALKTKDGSSKGNITFFCRVLHVSRQGYYQYLVMKDRPWKYQPLADAMKDILTEDSCNDTYGRTRMYQALTMKQPKNVDIPSERTVYRVMEEIGISHHPRRKPNGITKADREAFCKYIFHGICQWLIFPWAVFHDKILVISLSADMENPAEKGNISFGAAVFCF